MRHFVNKVTGSIVLIPDDQEKEIKKYEEDEDYTEYFMLIGD